MLFTGFHGVLKKEAKKFFFIQAFLGLSLGFFKALFLSFLPINYLFILFNFSISHVSYYNYFF
ncbi:MAG: hypothetical protein MRERV_46c010 [Mycoplasmataceae bacterium RV_VA103A]|nr:MAG: hypothetical protein MRERV_46c010 [Mycoplasmataceae bacterium RV_VA103A]